MSGSDPGSQPARRGAFWTFWTTLPGVLTGVAAVLTAIVGLIALLNGLDGAGSSTRTATLASGLPSQTAAQQPSSGPGSTAGSGTLPAGVLIQGTIRMRSPDDVDLEQGAVGLGVAGGDLYLYCSAGDCLLNAIGSGLMATAAGKAGRLACVDALTARHDRALGLRQLSAAKSLGQTLCVQSNESRVAALRIVGVPGVGTSEFVFSYTLWD